MELLEAIQLVCAHTREEEPDFGTDLDIIDHVRDTVDGDELAGWVETEVIETEEVAQAYRLVIDVNDDAIEDAFGND